MFVHFKHCVSRSKSWTPGNICPSTLFLSFPTPHSQFMTHKVPVPHTGRGGFFFFHESLKCCICHLSKSAHFRSPHTESPQMVDNRESFHREWTVSWTTDSPFTVVPTQSWAWCAIQPCVPCTVQETVSSRKWKILLFQFLRMVSLRCNEAKPFCFWDTCFLVCSVGMISLWKWRCSILGSNNQFAISLLSSPGASMRPRQQINISKMHALKYLKVLI